MVGEANEHESIQFLGIYLDKHLTFKQHINLLCPSVSKCIFAIKDEPKSRLAHLCMCYFYITLSPCPVKSEFS